LCLRTRRRAAPTMREVAEDDACRARRDGLRPLDGLHPLRRLPLAQPPLRAHLWPCVSTGGVPPVQPTRGGVHTHGKRAQPAGSGARLGLALLLQLHRPLAQPLDHDVAIANLPREGRGA